MENVFVFFSHLFIQQVFSGPCCVSDPVCVCVRVRACARGGSLEGQETGDQMTTGCFVSAPQELGSSLVEWIFCTCWMNKQRRGRVSSRMTLMGIGLHQKGVIEAICQSLIFSLGILKTGKFQFTWLPNFQENKPFTTKLAYMDSVIF